ncbi:DUF4383 domain-containing protein [Kineococcus sp. NUM-3379]
MDARSAVAAAPTTHGPSPLRTWARLVGVVFLVVGVLGFVPGITAHHDQLTPLGFNTGAMLLGLFQVSYLHNAAHLLYGLTGLACSATASAAHKYLVIGGLGYLTLFVIGVGYVLLDERDPIGLNVWDNWLHLVLALGMVGLGWLGYRKHRAAYGPF